MSDWYAECLRRFPAEEEEFGRDKPVNRVQPLVSVCIVTYQYAPRVYWNKFVRPKVADYRMRLSAELAGQGDTAGARREAWASLRTDPRVALSSPRKFIRAFVPSS
jgi:hypothetical protein